MIIIKHRSNSLEDIVKAIDNKWGIELDLRSYHGELIISHDLITDPGNLFSFSEALAPIKDYGIPTILDFKETDLSDLVPVEALPFCLGVNLHFLEQQKTRLNSLSVMSPHEIIDCNYGNIMGLWLQGVFTSESISAFAELTHKAVLVSPEVQGEELTDDFIETALGLNLMGVCTDFPERWK